MKALYPLSLLAAAACLAAALCLGPGHFSSRRAVSPAKSASKSTAVPTKGFVSSTSAQQPAARQRKKSSTNLSPSFSHRAVDLARYENYLEELHAKGISGSQAREMVEQRIHEDCNEERAQLLAQEIIPYWSHGYGLDEEKLDEFKAIDHAEWETLVGLFGLDAVTADTAGAIGETGVRTGGDLHAKREQIAGILGRYSREADSLTRQVDDEGQPKDSTLELAKLEREMDHELDKILTPEEREQFELRNSPTANAVRSSLRQKHVTVSEQEFRALFHERRKLDEKMLRASESGADSSSDYQAYLASAERILGPKRLALLE